MNLLQENYENKIKKDLMKLLKLNNLNEVPNIEKISVNMGLGSSKDNKDYIKEAEADLALITGQKPLPRYAKKSIAGFKLRENELIGYAVTLRHGLAWDLLEKLIKAVLPQVRDFRGLKTKAFDGSGNYSLGINEHFVFPEINPDKVKYIKTLQVNIKTTAKDDLQGKTLLESLGLPFRK